ncbi:MAG: hypothetical protein JSS29_10975 [Proteobacteria bacterium]|nr:hypothetical protein [Pseudomonadota bacterium]
MPSVLFPKQRECAEWILQRAQKMQPGLVEKSPERIDALHAQLAGANAVASPKERHSKRPQVDVTFVRALKVWWSFVWRGFVLGLAVMIPVEIVMFGILFSHMPTTKGQQLDPTVAARMFPVMALVWLVMMIGFVFMQGLAMRWMLRSAVWSDFRVAILPKDAS